MNTSKISKTLKDALKKALNGAQTICIDGKKKEPIDHVDFSSIRFRESLCEDILEYRCLDGEKVIINGKCEIFVSSNGGNVIRNEFLSFYINEYEIHCNDGVWSATIQKKDIMFRR